MSEKSRPNPSEIGKADVHYEAWLILVPDSEQGFGPFKSSDQFDAETPVHAEAAAFKWMNTTRRKTTKRSNSGCTRALQGYDFVSAAGLWFALIFGRNSMMTLQCRRHITYAVVDFVEALNRSHMTA